MTKYYQDNKDYLKEKNNQRNTTDKGRELNKMRSEKYRSTEEGKQKQKARAVINHGLRDGKLHKPDRCEICYYEKDLEAHHHDYDKPLEIQWLCKQCHENIHHLNEENRSL